MMHTTIVEFFANNDLFDEFAWRAMSTNQTLNEDFILRHMDKLDMNTLAKVKYLSTKLLWKIFNLLDTETLEWIAVYYPMTEQLAKLFAKRYPMEIVWMRVSQCRYLSDSFMIRYASMLDWTEISRSGIISTDEQLFLFFTYLDWSCICEYMHFSNIVLVVFAQYIDWSLVLRTHMLSVPMIQYMMKINVWTLYDLECLCQYQIVPENILEEYPDYFNWTIACKYQRFSQEFMTRNAERLDWIEVSKNQHLSWAFYQLFSKKFIDCENVNNNIINWSKLCAISNMHGPTIWNVIA